MATGTPDYWDHATMLEQAVPAKDRDKAERHLVDALAKFREIWELETTVRNLRLIREARQNRGESLDSAEMAERVLLEKIGKIGENHG